MTWRILKTRRSGDVQFQGLLPQLMLLIFVRSQVQLLLDRNKRSYKNPAFNYQLDSLYSPPSTSIQGYFPTKTAVLLKTWTVCNTAVRISYVAKPKTFRAMSKPLSTCSLCTPIAVYFKESHTVQIRQIIYIIARNSLFWTLIYEFNLEAESRTRKPLVLIAVAASKRKITFHVLMFYTFSLIWHSYTHLSPLILTSAPSSLW